MSLTGVDVAVVVAWVVVPAAALTIGRRNLRAAGSRAVSPVAFVAGLAGLAIVAVSLAPTVGRAAEPAFASHMVQHLALGLVAPLLLVVGRVPDLLPWSIGAINHRSVRRRLGWLTRPPRSVLWPTVVMVAVWYAWHVPALYGAAVENTLVHAVEHLSVLVAGCWYWAAIAPHRRRTGAVILASFTLTIALGLLGSVLSLSGVPFYGEHVRAVTESAQLDDQHLGGLLMWTPGGLVYLLASVIQLVRWLDIDGAGHVVPARADGQASP